MLNAATHHTLFPLAWINTPNVDLKSFGVQLSKRDIKREIVTKCWLPEILHRFGAACHVDKWGTWQQSCFDVPNFQSSKSETYILVYIR
jgi:hypothetical protein